MQPVSILDQMYIAQGKLSPYHSNGTFRGSTWSGNSLNRSLTSQDHGPPGLKRSQIHPIESNRSSTSDNVGSDQRSLESKKIKTPSLGKIRLQGLLIGLLIAVIMTGVALAVALTRPWENSTTSSSVITTIPATCSSLRWNRTVTVIAGTGSNSTAPQSFALPQGIHLDSNNSLYVADFWNHRIQQWLLNATVGITVAGISGLCDVANLSTVCNPRSIYVDDQQNLYIGENRGIIVWNWGDSSGTVLNGTSGISSWFDITMDTDGNLYATTSWYSQAVRMWPSSTGIPETIAGDNGPGSAGSQLINPIGLFVDSTTKTMYIANSQAHTIVAWKINETTGRIVFGQNLTAGSGLNTLRAPRDVRLDPYGNIYIVDTSNFRIGMICANSPDTELRIISDSGINSPQSLALDAQLNIYVSDSFSSGSTI